LNRRELALPDNYPWYQIVEAKEGLLQGDFIKECPIIIPSPEIHEGQYVDVDVVKYNTIVMSQSCDLAQGKIDLVLVCPVWPLYELVNEFSFLQGKKGKEELRKGNLPGYHLLNKCEFNEFETDYLVVDFRHVYSIHFTALKQLAESYQKRIRLLPPYREHLSQAFARFFMRVGLPVDIPAFR